MHYVSMCSWYFYLLLYFCVVLLKVCNDIIVFFQTSSMSGKKKPGKLTILCFFPSNLSDSHVRTQFLQFRVTFVSFVLNRDCPGDEGPLLYHPRTAESGKWPAHPHPQQERLWLVAWRTAGQCSAAVHCGYLLYSIKDPLKTTEGL